ncbi:hypothetical protein BMH52_15680 [Pseudomonas sp. BTN1]|nr:hypothetical protein BMH52_15680 [Pseudomonas sp. BTN1]
MNGCKMNSLAVTAALLAGFASSPAWSATGNDLVQWGANSPQGSKFIDGAYMGYISGIADFSNGVLFCAPKGVTNGQNVAIVSKFLKNNPERWAEQAPQLIVAALSAAYPACKAK